jgi:hypothetical protein
MRGGIYLGPAPFTAARLLSFAPDERDVWRPWSFLRGVLGRRARGPERAHETATVGRECPALAYYQSGCFAHHLSGGGFEAVMGPLCPCERSGARCVDRLR